MNEQYRCERCFNLHDGTYGSGRFCSGSCARSFSTATDQNSETKDIRCCDCKAPITVDKRASATLTKCLSCRKQKSSMRKQGKTTVRTNWEERLRWQRGADEKTLRAFAKEIASYPTMRKACLEMGFKSCGRSLSKIFIRVAKLAGAYKPNQSYYGETRRKESLGSHKLMTVRKIEKFDAALTGDATILVDRARMKDYLIRTGKRERKCEVCKRASWNKEAIPLSLHHIDGDGENNKDENLQLLCPNCHAQTDNFGGRAVRLNNEKRKQQAHLGELLDPEVLKTSCS